MSGIDPDTIGELFQEYTKYQHFRRPSDMVMGRPTPPVEKEIQVPAGSSLVRLPRDLAGDEQAQAFWRIAESRQSRRTFARSPLEIDELASLLWVTQGVLRMADGHTLRTVPSAGARHPLETYLIVNRVGSLPEGLYRYSPVGHHLVAIRQESGIGGRTAAACLDQTMMALSAVNFVWTSVIDRARWKYQQRAYRYAYLDAGHVCQNLYLACEALGLACCAVGAFDDDAMNQLIGVDGREEFVLYAAAVGRRPGG